MSCITLLLSVFCWLDLLQFPNRTHQINQTKKASANSKDKQPQPKLEQPLLVQPDGSIGFRQPELTGVSLIKFLLNNIVYLIIYI